MLKTAGVTFDNPDGENRQDILKNFGFGFRYAILKQTIFEDERAVEVWVDSKLIGYIPRTELDNPLSYESILVAQICYFEEKQIYHAILSEIQPPDEATAAKFAAYCETRNLDMHSVPVVADKRAYEAFMYKD